MSDLLKNYDDALEALERRADEVFMRIFDTLSAKRQRWYYVFSYVAPNGFIYYEYTYDSDETVGFPARLLDEQELQKYLHERGYTT